MYIFAKKIKKMQLLVDLRNNKLSTRRATPRPRKPAHFAAPRSHVSADRVRGASNLFSSRFAQSLARQAPRPRNQGVTEEFGYHLHYSTLPRHSRAQSAHYPRP